MSSTRTATDQPFPLSALRKDLARLPENGVVDYWVIEVGSPRLFRLNCVRAEAQARDDGDEDAALADAFVDVLRTAIGRLGSKQSQIVLTIVLGVHDEFPPDETTLQERREAAGQLFRRGAKPVTWGTIRKYHEPRALDQLVTVLAKMEQDTGDPTLLLS